MASNEAHRPADGRSEWQTPVLSVLHARDDVLNGGNVSFDGTCQVGVGDFACPS